MKKHILPALLFLLIPGLFGPLALFATKHDVHVGSYYFNPSSLSVSVGDTVRWLWDNGSHTTTSTVIPAGAASWDHPMNASNTVFEYKVTVAGSYNYKCTPHAGMGHLGSFTATAPAPTLTVAPPNQNVSSGAGSTSFTVTSNANWSATSNAAWCTVTSAGSGNGTITASYGANTATAPRTATITVSVTGLPAQTVTVSQSGAQPTLAVSPSVQNVTVAAGSTAFSVTSNAAWTAQSNQTWCTVTPSGNGNGTITATYTLNPGPAPRGAQITVTVQGLAPITVNVEQDGTVGVKEEDAADFRVYPNPSSGTFTLSLSHGEMKNGDVTLMDFSGKILQSRNLDGQKSYRFELQSVAEGVYFIRVRNGESTRVERLVIRK